MADQHDADVMALVDRLLALEYERGQLRERLELHLQIREVSAHLVAVPVQATPAPGPTPIAAGKRRRRIEAPILAAMNGQAQTVSTIAAAADLETDIVRTTLARLCRRGVIAREGRGTYTRAKGTAP